MTSVAPEMKHVPSSRERAMAVVRWALLLAVTVLAVYSLVAYGGEASSAHRPDRYYCTMHTQIRSPDPGNCPICGMRFVPIPRASRPHETSRVPGTVALMLPLARVQLADVATTPTVRRHVGGGVRAPAVVEAREGAVSEVHVRTPAFVERVLVRETAVHVTRGQTLALVYAPAIYAAERELVTITRAAAPDPRMLDAARSNLALLGVSAAEIAGVERTGSAPRDVALRAPAAGVVTRYDARPGSYATPDTLVYEITDFSRVWVVARIDASTAAGLATGAVARFTTDAAPEALEGRVERVEPELEAQTRTARVRIVVDNAGALLRPGQTGTVELPGADRDALVVPRNAVIDTGEQRYVFVARGGGEYVPVPVTTGAESGDGVEVVSGLAAGDPVVTRGGFLLDSESRLQAALAGDAGVAHAHGGGP